MHIQKEQVSHTRLQIFRRVVTNENRRRDYAYRLSYELDVGSSIDPDMEDIAALEEELLNPSTSANPANANVHAQNQSVMLDDGGDLPEDWDLDDEELAEMYEEYVREIEADQQQQQQQLIDVNPSIGTDSPVETVDDMYWAMDDLMEGWYPLAAALYLLLHFIYLSSMLSICDTFSGQYKPLKTHI